jgi:hypothetical protein
MGREPPVPDGGHAWAVISDMIAGGVAGVAADSVVHPIDTVKARMQVSTAASGPPYRSLLHAFRRIAAEEGVRRGLYAGYGAVLAGTVPTHAIMFATYKYLKRAAEPAAADAALPVVDLVCGGVGELVALAPYVPAEVVAKRMQIAALGPARDYSSTAHALRVIHTTEGVRGLYAGLAPTILRDVPFTAIQFSLFTGGKDLHRQWTGRPELSGGEATALGGVVGCIGAVATNPADIIKTRLMTQGSGADRPYRGVVDCFQKIVAEEGVAGLAKGMVPRVAWIAPASAITLGVYEHVCRLLNPPPLPAAEA